MAETDFRKVVHDLRNHIAPIRNVVYLLKLRASAAPGLAEATGIIERQIEGMTQLLDAVSASLNSDAPATPSTGSDAQDAAGAVAYSSSAPATVATTQVQRRILVADDSAAVCESFAAILRDLGHVVRTVHDGLAAVDAATAWMPDFVLLDVNMPKLNGYEAARRLRAKFPSSAMRLVMISGTDIDAGVTAAARQAGFDQCIDKILDFSALRKILEG